MAKAIVLEFHDCNPGVDDNNITLLGTVVFVGAGVPSSPVIDHGDGSGVPVPLALSTLTTNTYREAVETAVIARATALGITVAGADILMPSFLKGT